MGESAIENRVKKLNVIEEHQDRPMNIIEIAKMLNISDVMKILGAVSELDMNSLAARQIKEAFSNVLDDYTGVSSLVENI